MSDQEDRNTERKECEEALSRLPADEVENFDRLFQGKIRAPLLSLQAGIEDQEKSSVLIEQLDIEDPARWLKYFVSRTNKHSTALAEFLDETDTISREVWKRVTGKDVTPDFIRGVVYPLALGYVELWEEVIVKRFESQAPQFARKELELSLKHLHGRSTELRHSVRNRYYEIEAVELEFNSRLERKALESPIPQTLALTHRTGMSTRKGYRTEIREWMKRNDLETLEKAAERLNVSLSTLKSIMSDKGKARFGKAKLATVLSLIGQRET